MYNIDPIEELFLLKTLLIDKGHINKKPVNLVISEFRTSTFFTQYNLVFNDKVI